jgi:heat-inducible transcriptional repressor
MSEFNISELNERSQRIFRHIVDSFIESGDPVGSRTIARMMGMDLSPATIRNVMADMEHSGLLYSPHTSAGRLPTDAGLRIFVDGMMEIGDLSEVEKQEIEQQFDIKGKSLQDALGQASSLISGLSKGAGLVAAPTVNRPLRQIDFVNIGPKRVMAVLVADNGMVENRILETSENIPRSALDRAANFLNDHIAGKTLDQAAGELADQITRHRGELDELTTNLVEQGLASWVDDDRQGGQLIIRGQSNLLEEVGAMEDLDRIRRLFDILETRETMMQLLQKTGNADGVKIYIGSENTLFEDSGCSMIVSPYRNSDRQVVGAIGVIGPTRINYGRIVPIIDYTAKILGRYVI